jgi:L,D-peptidoglycan transpeptidase YkuD (ErfK/YbiS/YcfS/YnhG family)
MTDLFVHSDGVAFWRGKRLGCALGRSGVGEKRREGDGVTPVGAWPMRRLLYRADRLAPPATRLPVTALKESDGWCDDPADPRYNRPVALPCGASAETLWRADGLYDLIVPLGYNDDPVIAGRGSAIFLHVARADYAATEGCVALARDDLLEVLAAADERTRVVIVAAPAGADQPAGG